jgi:hypothetical protein
MIQVFLAGDPIHLAGFLLTLVAETPAKLFTRCGLYACRNQALSSKHFFCVGAGLPDIRPSKI